MVGGQASDEGRDAKTGKELLWRMCRVSDTLLRVRMLARETVDTVGNPLVILWTVMVGIRHTWPQ